MKSQPALHTIFFILEYRGESRQVACSPNEYYSLMALVSAHLSLLDFGICSGMGSCGTCLVEIRSKHAEAGQYCLACQVSVNDELSGTIVRIWDGNA